MFNNFIRPKIIIKTDTEHKINLIYFRHDANFTFSRGGRADRADFSFFLLSLLIFLIISK